MLDRDGIFCCCSCKDVALLVDGNTWELAVVWLGTTKLAAEPNIEELVEEGANVLAELKGRKLEADVEVEGPSNDPRPVGRSEAGVREVEGKREAADEERPDDVEGASKELMDFGLPNREEILPDGTGSGESGGVN